MDFSVICRTCLGSEYLRPIFKENDDFNSCSASILTATGLRIQKDDGMPQQICNTCFTILNETLKFREKCKYVENKLLAMINVKDDSRKLYSIKQRKNSKDDVKNGIKIEIDQEILVNEDDLPLNQLILSQNVKKLNNLKLENLVLKNDFLKEDMNKEFDLQVKLDSKSYISINKESKYETEFLDSELDIDINEDSEYKTEFLDFNIHIDTEETLSKENQIKTEYNFHSEKKLMEKDILISVQSHNEKQDIRPSTYSKKLSTHNTKYTYSNLKLTNERKHKHNFRILKNNDYRSDNNKVNVENIPLILNDSKLCQKESPETSITTHIAKKDPEAISDDTNNKIELNVENMHYTINNSNRVTCKICQKDLSCRSIDAHMAKKHPGEDGRKVKCDLCDVFITKQRLQRHKVTRHGLDCWKCAYCSNEFDTKQLLVDHVSTCTFKNRKRNLYASKKRKEVIVECEVCHKSMQKASLKTHQNIKHAGMRPVCEHCGRTFGNKFRFMEHLRAKHGHEKYPCSMCDFKTASTLTLKNHERRHRGEKPFICSQCGASFHARYLLAQHTHSHRTRRDMKCDQCPAAFKAKNSLHMHKMSCHNNNVFQCSLCPRLCKSRAILSRHVRTVHRSNPSTVAADAVYLLSIATEPTLMCNDSDSKIKT